MQTAHLLSSSMGRVDAPSSEAVQPTSSFWGSLGGLAVFAGASLGAAALGGYITSRRKNKAWYRLLSKPSFTPPDRLFSVVWPVLYSLSAISAWRVAKAPSSPHRSVALGLWSAQLAFNAAWSPLFFGQHKPLIAMADLVANYVALGAFAASARKVDTTSAYLTAPYLGWLTFAGALNGSIILRNRKRFWGLSQ